MLTKAVMVTNVLFWAAGAIGMVGLAFWFAAWAFDEILSVLRLRKEFVDFLFCRKRCTCGVLPPRKTK